MLRTVALLTPPFASLTYAVPEWLAGFAWCPGLRVAVPLGRGMLRIGVVLGDGSPLPEGVTARPMLWPLEKEPLLPSGHMEMVRQLALRQAVTPGQILAMVLPAGLRVTQMRLRTMEAQGKAQIRLLKDLPKLPVEVLAALGEAWMRGGAELLGPREDAAASELCVLRCDPPWAVRPTATRQIELLEDGKKVVQETRRWDDNKESSRAMRSKEDAKDYRYFPDPDLPPVTISDAWIQEIKDRQPELKTEKMARYQEEYGLSAYDADIITEAKHMADIFEATVSLCGKPKEAANWLMVEVMRLLKEEALELEAIRFSPENLAKLIVLVDNGTINRTVAKEVFEKIFAEDIDPEAYVEENGLKVVNDEGALRAVIREVIAANPQSVTDYHNGKERARGFLVGQTMRAMKGKADPAMVNRVLEELL